MEPQRFVVPPEHAASRLDFFLAQVLKDAYSRTKIKQLIQESLITVNGRTVKPHTCVAAGDIITLADQEEPVPYSGAEAIPLDIVFEDGDIIVVNKPAGLLVHPGTGNPSGTLLNGLLHYTTSLSCAGDPSRPGIVHRLDKGTSGLLVVAKTDAAHRFLSAQFKRHQVEKCYWAIVQGVVQHDEMRSEDPLGRSTLNRKKVVVCPDGGKASRTNFKVLKRFRNATLLEARPQTGRMHQIRVHLRALGHPVLGDLTYGVPSPHIHRQALHAKELGFIHPTTKQKVLFQSDLPSDMVHLLTQLE